MIGLLLVPSFMAMIAVFYVQWRRSRTHLYKLASKIPSTNALKPLPIIGIAHHFIGNTKQILKKLMIGGDHREVFGWWMGHLFFVGINTPEEMEVLLNSSKCLDKNLIPKMAYPLLGNGPFSTPVSIWKRNRKLIRPIFNQRILDEAVSVFSAQSDILVAQLLKTKEKTFDLEQTFAKYFLDIGIVETSKLKDFKMFGLMLLASLVVSIVLFYAQWRRSRRHLYELASKIPPTKTLKPLPIIGIAHHFVGNTEQILKNLMAAIDHPGIFGAWLAHYFFVGINTPEDLEVVLNSPKCLSKCQLHQQMSYPLMGKGIFAAPVSIWKKNRKLVGPTFNQRILDEAVSVFSQHAEILVEQLLKTKGKTFDLEEAFAKYSLDTVIENALGIKVYAQTSDVSYEHSISRCMDLMMVRIYNVPYHSDFIWNLTSLGREEQKECSHFHKLINKVLAEKKAEYKQGLLQENLEAAIDDSNRKRKVFIEHLIQTSENGANLTDIEMMDEVATFIVGGSDTTASLSCFAVIMIALHKAVEQKLYEEVIDILGPDREVLYTDLPKLTYLERVLKEALRLFPVAPTIVREVEEDVEVGGYILPKGAGIVLSIIGMHRSKLYWKDPMKFDPDRFTPEETAKRHKYLYVPFSAGPRNCVGIKYGMMSLKTMLATVIRRFRFETDYKSIEDVRVKQALVIKSVNGFPVRMISRH